MVKILVVEDDKAMNGFVGACLREKGYEVRACSDGVQALMQRERDEQIAEAKKREAEAQARIDAAKNAK